MSPLPHARKPSTHTHTNIYTWTYTDDFRLVLSPECKGQPPNIDLDSKVYKKVAGLEKMLEKAVPSLKHCQKLTVKGKVRVYV